MAASAARCRTVSSRSWRPAADRASSAFVELMTLTAELQQAAAALRRHRPEGPCDDSVRFTTVAESRAVTFLVRLGTPKAAAAQRHRSDRLHPFAARLAMVGRMDDWRRLLGFVTARSATDGGVRLEGWPPPPHRQLALLATAEQACCSFFSFSLTVDGRGVGFEVHAPDDALPIVHALFGAPA